MEFLRNWTICVCFSVIIATIFSLVTPNGNLGRFYKVVISLFVLISFIYPFKNYEISDLNFEKSIISQQDNNQIVSNMIEAQIKNTLINNKVNGATVIVKANQIENEIEINSAMVSVSNEYNCDDVKKIIFDNVGINAEVHKFGD